MTQLNNNQRRHMTQLVAALESGQYKKVCGNLCLIKEKTKAKSFCIWGVACDIYKRNTHRGRWEYFDTLDENSYEEAFVLNSSEYTQTPPSVVTNYFGLDEDEVERLIDWNDGTSGSKSFKALAKYLRKNYLSNNV